jgi:hypothetical protein
MYRFVTSLLVPFTIRVHIMDYPSASGNGSVYAPLTLLLDGAPILTHSYGGKGTLWLSTATSTLQTGVHVLTVASGAPGLSTVLGIDVIEIAPA